MITTAARPVQMVRELSDAWRPPDEAPPQWRRLEPDRVPELYQRIQHHPVLRLNTMLAVGDPFRGAHLVEAELMHRVVRALNMIGSTIPIHIARTWVAAMAARASAEGDRRLLADAYSVALRLPLHYCQGLLDGWGDWEPSAQFPEPEGGDELRQIRQGFQDGLAAWERCRRSGLLWYRGWPNPGQWRRYRGL